MRHNLITLIDEFLAESGMSAYRFGILAVSNGRLVERLRGGRRVWPETDAQVRAYIRAQRKTAVPAKKAGAA